MNDRKENGIRITDEIGRTIVKLSQERLERTWSEEYEKTFGQGSISRREMTLNPEDLEEARKQLLIAHGATMLADPDRSFFLIFNPVDYFENISELLQLPAWHVLWCAEDGQIPQGSMYMMELPSEERMKAWAPFLDS